MWILAVTLSAATAAAPSDPTPAAVVARTGPQGTVEHVQVQVPTAAPIRELRCVRPFTLDTPRPYRWTVDQALESQGTVVVVEVDPAWAQQRAIGGPVLFAGGVPVERTNLGLPGGVIVGLLPAGVDPAEAPLYFGPAILPERWTAADAAALLAQVSASGIAPLAQPPEGACGPSISVADEAALFGVLADVLDAHSPGETDLSETWRQGAAAAR